MKYLIYEMFSGVGFCNQLFSLETAVYMSNVSNRKLILLIKNPLCHCGSTSWDFGYLLDYFSNDYLKYLPNGIQVVYGINSDKNITDIIADPSKTKNIRYKDRFSNLVFVDKELDTRSEENKINEYLRGRHKEYLYFQDYDNFEYIYINQSNASRIFYNFYTTHTNNVLINNIAYSFTQLNEAISNIFDLIELPEKYLAIHLRFGDKKHDVSIINSRTNEYLNNTDFNLIKSLDLPVILMCDRKDSDFLNFFKTNNINVIYTDSLINKLNINVFKRNEVVQFLVEKYICDNSEIFIANQGSTVSSYVNYVRYINNKPHVNFYSNTKDKISNNNFVDFIENHGPGRLLSWQCFWTNNVIKNPSNFKIITLTNNGYKELTENLLLSMKRIGIMHTLKIYCLDYDCYTYFNNNYPYNEVELINDVDSTFSNWIEYKAPQSQDIPGKKLWAAVTKYKIIVINYELTSGNDVVFIDGDIVINESFIKDLYNNIGNNDLLIQNDNAERGGKDCMCTGFFLMKSNEKTLECTNINNINMDEFLNDQQYLRWAAIKYNLSHKFLDLELYPNGKYYRTYKPNSNIIHFNYDSGEAKIRRMKQFNYYYIQNNYVNITFKEWLNLNINKDDIIINSSVQDCSDRLTNIPIGVQHDFLKYFNTHKGINNFINNSDINTKLCLSSFSRNTDRNRREKHCINRNTISSTVDAYTFVTKQRFTCDDYFNSIGKYKFVISPEGNGIDTHRHWETLYSKGIPIIEDNDEMKKKLEGLPVLWTKDYTELTEEYLEEKYKEILETKYDFSYLFLSFYGDKLKDEIYQRSKFWCFKKNLGDFFNEYYKTINFNTPIIPEVIHNNNHRNNNNVLYYALRDGDGIPLDKKLYDLFNKENGVFIDVGAHDGVIQSNTLYLEKHKKWNGICITPNKDKYFECIKNRPNSISQQYACVEPTYNANTIQGDFWKLSGSRAGIKNNTQRVEHAPSSTLTNILDLNNVDFNVKYKKNLLTDIDFIKIDTCTQEYDVLLGLDLNKYKPKYLLIEILKDDYDKIVQYLKDHDYSLVSNFSNYNKTNHRRWDGTHNDYLFKSADPIMTNEGITLTIEDIPSTPLKSFAQINQDINVLDFYERKTGGFFVDVGAYDGVKFSNTLLLEKDFEWNGICIEPGKRFFQRLTENRTATCIEKAVFDKSDLELDFLDCGDDDENGSMLSGLITKTICNRTISSFKETYKVKTKTLTDILKENNAPKFIEYLSIDVEGAEPNVLRSIDFKEYTFGYISVEFNNSGYMKKVIDDILLENGYVFKQFNEFDIDYIHNSLSS